MHKVSIEHANRINTCPKPTYLCESREGSKPLLLCLDHLLKVLLFLQQFLNVTRVILSHIKSHDNYTIKGIQEYLQNEIDFIELG